jgi:acetolactate synthase I/II/III large subunit
VNVPVDLAWLEVDYEHHKPGIPLAQSVAPGSDAMDLAVGIIASARRPIVVGGAGARDGGAPNALRVLADALGAPLATTLAAKGLFGAHDQDLGVFGTLSAPETVEAIAASDCLIFVGASLHEHTGGGDGFPYLRGKKVVQCDVDGTVLGRCHEVDALVLGDGAVFAETAAEWLKEAGHTPSGFRDALSKRTVDSRLAGPATEDALTLTHLLAALEVALPADRSFTIDGGRFAIEAIQRLRVASPRSCAFSSRGFGAVGNGIATAIGIGIALPEAPTVAVVGDGGFMLGGLAEFNTAVRYGVDLVVVVCNDGAYGAEFRKLRRRDLSGDVSKVSWPDLAPVADALGGRGYTVRTVRDLEGMRREIDGRDRPLLIDVKLDPNRGSD